MSRLSTFTFLSLDGYYKDMNNGTSWHKHGEEESKFSEENLKAGNLLLFGRVTYEMMAGFWTSPMASVRFPSVAAGMNSAGKVVFSKTIKQADWMNTRLVSDDMIREVKKLKQSNEKDITLLGSGSILRQLAENDLIDEYQVMIDPVALGNGVSVFQGISAPLELRLTGTRTFRSGAVLLTYVPAR
jgi:dihydrofolate reductase